MTDGDGEEVALCSRGTDETDCGARVAVCGKLVLWQHAQSSDCAAASGPSAAVAAAAARHL